MKSESDFSLESRLASWVQPDILLPSQYLATVCRNAQLEPEKKLMLAVLEDGVLCFQRYILARDSKGESLFHDAESWVLEENDDRIFSFENLCEALGLDPKYVRQGLLHWKERKLAEYRAQSLPFDLYGEDDVLENETKISAGRTVISVSREA